MEQELEDELKHLPICQRTGNNFCGMTQTRRSCLLTWLSTSAISKPEEADTRMILHLGDAFHKGFRKMLLRTVDTDVVVLSVAAATKLDIPELWVAFGTGKNFRYIPVHEIVASIGPYKSQALPFFHAYTGCDSVSSFATRGKKSAWDNWRAFEEVTTTFLAFSTGPDQVSNEDVAVLEWFTITVQVI